MNIIEYQEEGNLTIAHSGRSVWIIETDENLELLRDAFKGFKDQCDPWVLSVKVQLPDMDSDGTSIEMALSPELIKMDFGIILNVFRRLTVLIGEFLEKIGAKVDSEFDYSNGKIRYSVFPSEHLSLRAERKFEIQEYKELLSLAASGDMGSADIAANTDDPSDFKSQGVLIAEDLQKIVDSNIGYLKNWSVRHENRTSIFDDILGAVKGGDTIEVGPSEDATRLAVSLRKIADQLDRLAVVSQV